MDYLWLRLHKSLQSSECKRCRDWNSYIEEMVELVPMEQREQKVYLILDYGWVYEGYLPVLEGQKYFGHAILQKAEKTMNM